MGLQTTNTFENIYLKIKAYFEATPAEDSFHNAFRLAILLHEAAVTRGYKDYCPWNTDRNHGLEEHPYKWGYSACSEPEGNTVYAGNGIFIASGKTYQSPTITQLKNLCTTLKSFTNKNVLKAMYALYEITIQDFDTYVALSDIAAKTGLTETETLEALENLPLSIKEAGIASNAMPVTIQLLFQPLTVQLVTHPFMASDCDASFKESITPTKSTTPQLQIYLPWNLPSYESLWYALPVHWTHTLHPAAR